MRVRYIGSTQNVEFSLRPVSIPAVRVRYIRRAHRLRQKAPGFNSRSAGKIHLVNRNHKKVKAQVSIPAVRVRYIASILHKILADWGFNSRSAGKIH